MFELTVFHIIEEFLIAPPSDVGRLSNDLARTSHHTGQRDLLSYQEGRIQSIVGRSHKQVLEE